MQAWWQLDDRRDTYRDLRMHGNAAGAGLMVMLLFSVVLFPLCMAILSAFGVADFEAGMNGTDDYFGMPHDLFLLVYAGVYIVMMVFPFFLSFAAFRILHNPFARAQSVPPLRFTAAVMLGLGGIGAAQLITMVWQLLCSLCGVELGDMPSYMEHNTTSLVLNLIVTAVLPALLEELVFRGWLLGGLRKAGDTAAVVISALLFGLMHGNLVQFPFATMLGLLMGYLVVRTGNIWVAVVIHFLNNAFAVFTEYAGLLWGDITMAILSYGFLFGCMALALITLIVLVVRQSPLLYGKKEEPVLPHGGSVYITAPCLVGGIAFFVIEILAFTWWAQI